MRPTDGSERVPMRAGSPTSVLRLRNDDPTVERRVDRLRQLLAATTALASTRTTHEVTDAVVRTVAAELGATSALLAFSFGDLDGVVIAGQRGFRRDVDALSGCVSPNAASPVAVAMRDRAVVPVGTIASADDLFGGARDHQSGGRPSVETMERYAGVVIPILDTVRQLGVAAFRYPSARLITARDRAQLLALGRQIGGALERSRQADAERDARLAAEAQSRAKTRVVAALSHELRTPLGAIAGYAELLQAGVYGPLTETQSMALTGIVRNEAYLAALVTQLLDLARIEAGRVAYQPESVALGDALRTVHAMIQPQLGTKTLTLSIEVAETAIVRVDVAKLHQILLNLLSNAVKFTARDGRITVDLDDDPLVPSMHRLRVSDSGIGIPASQSESIFEPFVQLRERTPSSDGVGLGLAISRELARRMGGDLRLGTSISSGATFVLSLPRG